MFSSKCKPADSQNPRHWARDQHVPSLAPEAASASSNTQLLSPTGQEATAAICAPRGGSSPATESAGPRITGLPSLQNCECEQCLPQCEPPARGVTLPRPGLRAGGLILRKDRPPRRGARSVSVGHSHALATGALRRRHSEAQSTGKNPRKGGEETRPKPLGSKAPAVRLPNPYSALVICFSESASAR